VVIFITLLAGFIPLLQVTFIALLEDYLSRLTRCERSGQNSRIIPLILITKFYWGLSIRATANATEGSWQIFPNEVPPKPPYIFG
jgi:hypothetical protein